MSAHNPKVPIHVEPDTGVWTTDGLPMIYLPRHFYINHQSALETAFGREALHAVLYDAGYKSAWQWCEKESQTHGLRGTDVFRHYMTRLSQRGWGRFSVLSLDEETGEADIRLEDSIYVLHHGKQAARKLCYPFDGWFPGALEWAGRERATPWALRAQETRCVGEGDPYCLFEVRRRAP